MAAWFLVPVHVCKDLFTVPIEWLFVNQADVR